MVLGAGAQPKALLLRIDLPRGQVTDQGCQQCFLSHDVLVSKRKSMRLRLDAVWVIVLFTLY